MITKIRDFTANVIVSCGPSENLVLIFDNLVVVTRHLIRSTAISRVNASCYRLSMSADSALVLSSSFFENVTKPCPFPDEVPRW